MFKSLKKEDVEKVHSLSLKILSNVGIKMDSKKALAILKDAGARIIPEKKRAYISPSMVEKALRDAPSSFTIYGQEEGKGLQFKRGREPLFGGSGVPFVIHDLETGVRRKAKLKDFVSIVRLFDSLSNVDLVTDSCTFTDVPGRVRDIAALFYLSINTRKPFLLHITFTNEEDFNQIIEMTNFLKEIVFGGRPFVIFRISPLISPLRFDNVHTNHLINAVKAGIPVCPVSMPQAGVSSPASLAGTLTLMNAEVLALLVISQIIKPGAAFLYGPVPAVTNFMTGAMLLGSIEVSLLNIATNQLAEYYNLPNWATAGRTDSKIMDIQTGYEHSIGVPLIALSGATYISAISGLLESGEALSFEKIAIEDEIVGMTKRILKKISTSPQDYAFELIVSVGSGGNFFAEQHTVDYMRKEFFFPKVSEFSTWDEWKKKGEPTALIRAKERVKEIIASYSAPSLSDNIVKQIKDNFPNIFTDITLL